MAVLELLGPGLLCSLATVTIVKVLCGDVVHYPICRREHPVKGYPYELLDAATSRVAYGDEKVGQCRRWLCCINFDF